jgi:hypothetical protein
MLFELLAITEFISESKTKERGLFKEYRMGETRER